MWHRRIVASALALGMALPSVDTVLAKQPHGAGDDRSVASRPPVNRPATVIKDSYIVTFAPGAARPAALAERLAQRENFGVRHVYEHALSGMAITLPAHAAPRVLEALRRNPNIAAIGNDMMGSASAQVLPKGIDRVNAEPSLAPNRGDGIRIGVIDSGIDFDHADLAGAVDTSISVDCVNFVGCGAGGRDDNSHGTFVAGVLAARDNDIDVVGAAPAADLFSVKVLKSDNTGTASDFIAGLDHVAALNASGLRVDVLNASIVFTCSVCTDDSTNATAQAMHSAVRKVVEGGTTVVVAAGNNSQDARTTLPAAFDEVITVSALQEDDGAPGGESFAWFSNFGADIDLIAPGVGETSLRNGGGTRTGSGTSFSSPNVAGVAALFIRDHLAKTGSRPQPATVRRALIETGECASALFHDGLGCDAVWSGDPDGMGEPMVRADNIASFTQAVSDLAVTALEVPTPAIVGEKRSVSVGVSNEGAFTESFSVTLADNGVDVSAPVDLMLEPGASRTVSFDWTPQSTGDHLLAASAGPVVGENVTDDNSRSLSVTVQEADIHDMAVSAISAPGTATAGDTLAIAVDVANEGTADDMVTVSLTATGPDGGRAGSVSPAQQLTVAAGSTVTLRFDWDSSGVSSGDHVLEAAVELDTASDSDASDNARSATVSLTSPEPRAATQMYVWDLALDVRRRGKGGSEADLLGAAVAQWDSDGDGIAESNDQALKNAGVDILAIQDSNADGVFDCNGADRCWSVAVGTNGKGEAGFSFKSLPAGSYRVAVTGLAAAGLAYDGSLDRANPAHIQLR